MDIVFIILVVFAVSFALSIFQIVRQGITFQALVSAIIAGAIFALVLFVYLDLTDFRNNFEDSEKLFLLQDESQQFIAGFSGMLTKESAPEFLDSEELAKKQAEYDAKDIEAFVGPYYKVFVVSNEFFASLATDVDYGNMSLTHEEVLGIINSEQPTSALADRYMQKLSAPDPTGAVKAQLMNDLRRQAHDDASMRSFLFAMLVSDSVEREGPNLLILGIAADRVAVFKETPLFLLIRYTPPSLLAEVAQIEGEDEPSE